MIGHHRLGAPVTGLALFVALASIPLVALGWLGWRLLDQDRALESQRLRERLENAATLAARELDRSLGVWSALLAPAARGDGVAVPPGAALVVFDENGVVRHQGVALPYYPGVPPAPEPLAAAFGDAETVELRDRNLSQAAGAYRAFAASPHSGVRAAALVRLARVLRKQAREKEALAVYGQLVALGDAPVAGAPAGLVGLRERIALLKATGRDAEAAEEAARLAEALHDGRFRLDRATFDFYREPFVTGPTEQGSAGRARTPWPSPRLRTPRGLCGCATPRDVQAGRTALAHSRPCGSARPMAPRRSLAASRTWSPPPGPSSRTGRRA